MKAIRTADLQPDSIASTTEKLWIYNGLDCCVTVEVHDVLLPQLDNQTRATYEFEKALMGPILEMNMHGVLVDQSTRASVVAGYRDQITRLVSQLNRILEEGVGIKMNWNSPAQLKKLLYETMGIPVIKKRNSKGVYTPTVDRTALERLTVHFLAQPIINHILTLRDIAKKISVLETEIDADGRMRTSYNIGGTNTGRLSSSLNEFGTGGNLQNIEEKLRSVFVADPGMKFAYIDLEQAESRAVGAIEWNLFHDGRYLDACESGDLHTSVCRLAWSELPWVDNLKADRDIAERPFYRQHSYRHMAKVLGHGTNYLGTPWTMAKHTKLDANTIKEFQRRYFLAFPAHPKWHDYVRAVLKLDGHLTTLTGRRRYFFGRRDDDATVREAVAFDPQGSVGDILNLGLLQVWRANICEVLLQIHDAILIQYPESEENTVIPAVQRLISVPIPLRHNRTLLIPSDVKTGWNWGNANSGNPDGLLKYTGKDDRSRSPKTSILDQRFR